MHGFSREWNLGNSGEQRALNAPATHNLWISSKVFMMDRRFKHPRYRILQVSKLGPVS